MIKGFGSYTLKPLFSLENPQRTIIDIDNAVLKTSLRNKSYPIGNLVSDNPSESMLNQRDILRIAQFDTNTVRLVIQGENCKNYRLVVSPDGQNIYIAKRQNIINAKLTSNNAVLSGYTALKEGNTNVLSLKFDSPVSLSVFEENSIAYFDTWQ